MNRKTFLAIALFIIQYQLMAQYSYEPSEAYPYGRLNPEAPEQTADFGPMIGVCDCQSELRNADQSWGAATDMTWKFRYIMNGLAVQDETLKPDGSHSGSIRQYNADSARWYVHYYASAAVTNPLSSWEGNLEESGDIVLYREQKAPNGMDGFYRLTFYHITEEGFDWVGEWVNVDETIAFPTWKISCKKRGKG
ncbi:MAG: hypothetical protein AAFQ94_17040 [Bacteroidota bacterium]